MPEIKKLYKLTDVNGKPVYVNEAHIAGVNEGVVTERTGGHHTAIQLHGGKHFKVKEPIEALVNEMVKNYELIEFNV